MKQGFGEEGEIRETSRRRRGKKFVKQWQRKRRNRFVKQCMTKEEEFVNRAGKRRKSFAKQCMTKEEELVNRAGKRRKSLSTGQGRGGKVL